MQHFTRADWAIIQDTFDALCDASPVAQQAALAKANLPQHLHKDIAALLAAHNDQGLLDTPWTGPKDQAAPDDDLLQAGQEIGAFKVVLLIGRGGMGEVYLGERIAGGFDQRVAIKIMRGDHRGQLALFNAERRIVAGLEHPGVARVIDGGITQDGQPFMAMEYVEGVPLTRWCFERALPLKARLALFVQVCEAVAYAHKHLVIHRDIKPSNILVDKDGRPRLLDFGVAQMVDEAFGSDPLPITPEYAAPEQLRGAPSSTAMDVYGLGALLFEILSGHGPWQSPGSRLPAFMVRLREDTPPLVSEAARADNPDCIPALHLRGDLDLIVAKALHPEAEQRYASVEALMADLARFVEKRPIAARIPTLPYRAGLYAKRHTWAVAAYGALALAIIGGVTATAWQARVALLQRDIARAEVQKTQAVNQALSLMFANAGESAAGRQTTAKDMLDKSATDIVNSFAGDDQQATEIILALADLYTNLEDQLGQATLLSAALDKGIGDKDPAAKAHMQLGLAEAYIVSQRLAEAKALLEQAGAFYGQNQDKHPKLYLQERGARAALARLEGRSQDGIAILKADMPAVKIAYADAPRELLARYNNLIVHLVEANELKDAGLWLDEAEVQITRLKQSNTQVANGIGQMRGGWQMRMGDKEAALATFTRVMNVRKDLYGPSSGLAMDMLQVGRTLVSLEREEEALPILEAARAMADQYMGTKNVPYLVLNVNICFAYAKLGKAQEAEAALERARPIAQSLPEGAPPAALFKQAQAVVFLAKGQIPQAKSALEAAQTAFVKLGNLGAPYLVSIEKLQAQIRQKG